MKLRNPLLAFALLATLMGVDVRLTQASNVASPRLASCPTDNNACNNDDGCVDFFPASDSLYYVHWVGMARFNSTTLDKYRLHCKDRYRKLTLANGSCGKGEFVEAVCEQGCSGVGCPHP